MKKESKRTLNLILIALVSLFIFNKTTFASSNPIPFYGPNSMGLTNGPSYASSGLSGFGSHFWHDIKSATTDETVASSFHDGLVFTDDSLTVVNYGISFDFSPFTNLSSGYVYSLSTLICSTKADNTLSFQFSATGGYGPLGTNLATIYRSNRYSVNNNYIVYGDENSDLTYGYCTIYNVVFSVSSSNTNWVHFRLTSPSTGHRVAVGYNLVSLGNTVDLNASDISNIVNDANVELENNISNDISESNSQVLDSISEMEQEISSNMNKFNETQEETNNKIDDIINSDLDSSDKELPNDDSFKDYSSNEDVLKESMQEADMSILSIGIDSTTSSWIWNTLTSLIQSHTLIFGLFISILSIGIIKLALGR